MHDAWRIYIAEGVRMVSESSAKYAGGQYMTAKWSSIIDPKPKDNRTGAEIAADVINRAGLVVKRSESI